MKTIQKLVAGFALVAVVISCSKDDDELATVSPVSVEFVQDIIVMEQNGKIDIPLEFNTPATSNGIIIVKVVTEAADAFQTTPPTAAGEIEISVNKGATAAVLGFTPQDDQILAEERTVTLEISSESEGFVPGADKSITVTITDNEAAAAATFLNAEGFVEEDLSDGTEITVWLSHPAPGDGTISIQGEGSAANLFTTTPAMDSNNTILLEVQEGVQEIKFKVLPVNNSKIGYHQNFKFTIAETSGVIIKGELINMNLNILDDELQGKPRSEIRVTDDATITKTWEYDTEGRIYRVREEITGAQANVVNYDYHYNEEGQLISITTFSGNWENFKWDNGKVVQSEHIQGFFKMGHSNFEYNASGQIIKKTDYGQNDNRLAAHEYDYYSNGDLKAHRKFQPGTGQTWNLVSSLTYESYLQKLNPFPVVIIPTVVSQVHLPATYRIQEGNSSTLFYYTYEYGYEDRVVKRFGNGETITYSYY